MAGFVTSLIVTASAIMLSGVPAAPLEEAGSISFIFLMILIPFLVLPSLRVVSRGTLLTLVLVTVLFWILVLASAGNSRGGVNIGLGFAVILSPVLIGSIVLVIERLLGSRAG